MIEADVSQLSELGNYSGSLSDRVYHAIRDAILSLRFAPGVVIRKAPICERLQVSRSPVADALRRLSEDGLVDIVPQSATRVSKLSLRVIREQSFLREALELAAVARAAELRSEQQLARLARNMRHQRFLVEDLDFAEFYKFDEEFHDLIFECCDISLLAPTVESVSLQVQRARLLLLPEPGRTADTVDEHDAIFAAIREQNPAAAVNAMRSHLRQLIKRLEPLERERPEMFTT